MTKGEGWEVVIWDPRGIKLCMETRTCVVDKSLFCKICYVDSSCLQ